MAERTTLARPYARAIFDLARESTALAAWSEFLEALAEASTRPEVAGIVADPTFTSDQITGLFAGIAGEGLGAAGDNLVRLLAERRRLELLPEIAELYETHRASAERVVDVEVVAAYPVDEAQQARLAQSLKARLGCDVRLHCEIDESLIGGAVIRAGDLVIDGSVRDRLRKLAETISF